MTYCSLRGTIFQSPSSNDSMTKDDEAIEIVVDDDDDDNNEVVDDMKS